MKILVIGGSYFFGRVFVMLAAKEHDVTVVNRGTYSMEEFGVRQVRGDRRDPEVWRGLTERYDAVVDFCAYQAGDTACALENLAGDAARYLLISTVDVYRRGTGALLREDAPLEDRSFPGEAGEYILGKKALEQETRLVCSRRETAWTIIRPAILYGPYNYAPRESLWIRMAVQKRRIPRITDADGFFQLVYVKDAAQALLRCLETPDSCGQAYNLCQDGVTDYEAFWEALSQAAGAEVETVSMTAEEAAKEGIPLPFPVYAPESERYDNGKSKRELGISYLPLGEGMRRTYNAFQAVYRS